MMSNTTKQDNKRGRLIALIVTILVAIIVVAYLMLVSIGWDKQSLSKLSTPAEEEELYIDPELMELGELDAMVQDAPSPAPQGEPEQSEIENDEIVTPGENPKQTKSTEKLVSTDKESTHSTEEPTKTEKPESAISSSMKDKFSPHNGKQEGSEGTKGAGGSGSGVSGSVNGRSFQGCPLPSVKVNKNVTIYVSIVVDESGKVIEARFKSDKGAGAGDSALREACVKASYNARWSSKRGERRATGTLVWNLKPRS